MPKVFFIADTHFGHKEIIEYENRPFQTVDEMDNALIENWNRTVKKRDKIFMLGDFALAGKDRVRDLLNTLNGYKILIIGNHDKAHSLTWWKSSGFDEVIKYPVIFEEWFILSHEPVYVNTNAPYANIYGHVHGNPAYADYSARSFCASAERIRYTPVDFSYIKKMMGDVKKNEQ